MNSVNIVEIFKNGGINLEVYDGFLSHNMHYISYIEFVSPMVAKRDRFKEQGKELLQTVSKKKNNSVYGGNFRKDVNNQLKCETESWMKKNCDDGITEWWPPKNCNLIVKPQNDAGVDDQDIAKSIIQMPCHLAKYKLGETK